MINKLLVNLRLKLSEWVRLFFVVAIKTFNSIDAHTMFNRILFLSGIFFLAASLFVTPISMSLLGIFILLALAHGMIIYLANMWIGAIFNNPPATGRVDLDKFASDPYRIAYLSDGNRTVIELATFSLYRRGLLTASKAAADTRFRSSLFSTATHGDLFEAIQNPIEQSILLKYQTPRPYTESAEDFSGYSARVYEDELVREHLKMSTKESDLRRCTRWFFMGLSMLLISAFIPLPFTIAAGFFVFFYLSHIFDRNSICDNRRSYVLESLRNLSAEVKLRVAKAPLGGEINDAIMVVAIFGLYGTFSGGLDNSGVDDRDGCGAGGCGTSAGGSDSGGDGCEGGGCGGCGGCGGGG